MNQADLIRKADRIIEAAKKRQGQSNVLWKYTDDEGNEFYLMKKMTGTIRSPFTGKSFKANPVREGMTDVTKNLKEEHNKGK